MSNTTLECPEFLISNYFKIYPGGIGNSATFHQLKLDVILGVFPETRPQLLSIRCVLFEPKSSWFDSFYEEGRTSVSASTYPGTGPSTSNPMEVFPTVLSFVLGEPRP